VKRWHVYALVGAVVVGVVAALAWRLWYLSAAVASAGALVERQRRVIAARRGADDAATVAKTERRRAQRVIDSADVEAAAAVADLEAELSAADDLEDLVAIGNRRAKEREDRT